MENLRSIKSQAGPDLILSGSSTFTSPLLQHNLVDELLLIVYPVLLGTGKRLFAAETPARSFDLVRSTSMPSGVVLSTYRPTGPMNTGAVTDATAQAR